VALGGLLILAMPGWMMLGGLGGGYAPMMPGGMWLNWATQFLWLSLLVIGVGGVRWMKTRE